MPDSLARAVICAARMSSELTSPPSSSSASSSGLSTAFSRDAASPACELCASSAMTAKRLPWVAVLDVLGAQLFALAAQALAHLLPEAAGIDELHLALAFLGLAVADDPHVGADARVVEHVGGQPDDGLDQ